MRNSEVLALDGWIPREDTDVQVYQGFGFPVTSSRCVRNLEFFPLVDGYPGGTDTQVHCVGSLGMDTSTIIPRTGWYLPYGVSFRVFFMTVCDELRFCTDMSLCV